MKRGLPAASTPTPGVHRTAQRRTWPGTARWVLALCAAMSASVPGFAQEETQRAAARVLAEQGIALRAEGKVAEALERFEKAQALYDAPTHLMLIAQCHVALGRLVEGSETYRKLARAELDPKAPKQFVAAREEAIRELASLLPRIPRLRVNVQPANVTGLNVRINGRVIPTLLVGEDGPINPGKYSVEATAPGYQSAVTSVDITEKERKQVVLTMARAPEPTPASSAPPSTSVPAPLAPAPSASLSPEPRVSMTGPRPSAAEPLLDRGSGSWLIWGGFGFAVVGLGLGAAAGFLSASNTSDLQTQCPSGVCPPEKQEQFDSAHRWATVSNVALGVAVAGAGLGVYGLIRRPAKPSAASSRGLMLSPAFGLAGCGLQGRF